ncbi:MAG: alpha/beta fold hydrolase [Gammaproteobacteria bacterium]|nr:alpha/beta fold hydrolase [Gammaproteobacteria bacterium]
MLLHARKTGEGYPLVILHGLFGAGDNWASISRSLVTRGLPVEVSSLDLRNHGLSPHATAMDYPALAEDVRETLAHAGIREYHLLGHSMGGKVALQLACNSAAHDDPHIKSLTIVDIAPRAYRPSHQTILDALNSLEPARIKSHGDASEQLTAAIPAPELRQFLLKNLRRNPAGGYRWQLNLGALTAGYPDLLKAPEFTHQFMGPAQLIRGAKPADRYVNEEDLGLLKQWCPHLEPHTIEDAGHWPHATHAPQVVAILLAFLGDHTP